MLVCLSSSLSLSAERIYPKFQNEPKAVLLTQKVAGTSHKKILNYAPLPKGWTRDIVAFGNSEDGSIWESEIIRGDGKAQVYINQHYPFRESGPWILPNTSWGPKGEY